MPVLHEYGAPNHHLNPYQLAGHLKHWNPGLHLVFEMEQGLKNVNLFPTEDSPDNVGLLKLESQFLSLISPFCDSALYICPVVRQDKLFIRYIEAGMYRGFTKKFLPVLAQKHLVSVENCFMWNVYTDMDIQEKSKKGKKGKTARYKGHRTRGFQQLQYSNKTSVGHCLADVKKDLDPLKSVIYIQKQQARLTHDHDR